LEIPSQTGQIVKKVLYGGLFPPAIKALCDSYGLSVKGKKIEYAEFFKILFERRSSRPIFPDLN